MRIARHTAIAVSAAALIALVAPVSAQTTAAAPKTTAAAATSGANVKPTKAQRTAKSLDCSKQADAKDVHGKARRKFMSSCKRG